LIRRFSVSAVLLLLPCPLVIGRSADAREPIPEKLVVLTFDDAVKSQFTVARPILLRYGFGATFFITEGFDFPTNKRDYMTWGEIAQLHRDGFEIGNHTRDHMGVTEETLPRLAEQIEAINARCQEHGIPKTVSFAYPGNAFVAGAFPILRAHGIRFARRGGAPEWPYDAGRGFAFEPGFDHPLRIPSAGDARPTWEMADFLRAIGQAREGRIAVLQFHGVPDRAHPWVNTDRPKFAAYMHYLAMHGYHVIAMRDLARYVDPHMEPNNPDGVIKDRERSIAEGFSRENGRRPTNDAELRYWLENMILDHGFHLAEITAATGMPAEEVEAAIKRFGIERQATHRSDPRGRLYVVPYPGGRHPRIGFRDGEIRPQRETKASVFLPWAHGGYVVLDLPEAIWVDQPEHPALLYLAHTHVPTLWDRKRIRPATGKAAGKQDVPSSARGAHAPRRKIVRAVPKPGSARGVLEHRRPAGRTGSTFLAQLEWTRHDGGALSVERRLPNGVIFGTRVVPSRDAVRMEMWITNGTDETLTGLRVQNCVMLAAAAGFASQTNDNKLFAKPYVACHNKEGDHWIITAWQPCVRAWGNAACPCLHSDPQFPDCPPGRTEHLKGWLSFYDGTDIQAELKRIAATGWDR